VLRTTWRRAWRGPGAHRPHGGQLQHGEVLEHGAAGGGGAVGRGLDGPAARLEHVARAVGDGRAVGQHRRAAHQELRPAHGRPPRQRAAGFMITHAARFPGSTGGGGKAAPSTLPGRPGERGSRALRRGGIGRRAGRARGERAPRSADQRGVRDQARHVQQEHAILGQQRNLAASGRVVADHGDGEVQEARGRRVHQPPALPHANLRGRGAQSGGARATVHGRTLPIQQQNPVVGSGPGRAIRWCSSHCAQAHTPNPTTHCSAAMLAVLHVCRHVRAQIGCTTHAVEGRLRGRGGAPQPG